MGYFSWEISVAFPWGKPAALKSHYPTLINFLEPSACGIFVCGHTTGCEAYYFTTDGYGIFNMHTNVGAWCTYQGGSGTNKSVQELTRIEKTLTLPRQGIEPRVFRLEFQRSNHWAILVP